MLPISTALLLRFWESGMQRRCRHCNRIINSFNDMVCRRNIKYGLIFMGIVLFFVNCSVKSQEEIATIDGRDVTRAELDREMQRCRASVINQIVDKYGVTDMTGFWEREYGGQTPLEIIQQRALDTLVVFKVQERLLAERNLWPYKHYSELISDLEKTNEARAKAAKEGAVIYGPISYT